MALAVVDVAQKHTSWRVRNHILNELGRMQNRGLRLGQHMTLAGWTRSSSQFVLCERIFTFD